MNDLTPVTKLQLPKERVRILNAFHFAGIKTIGELCGKRPSDLLRLKNFGLGSLGSVRIALAKLGITLFDDAVGAQYFTKSAKRPRTREQEKVFGQFLQNVATCIDAEKRMAEMTDAELADVLDVQLGQTDIDSVLFEVLDQAIKRLRRSGGGPVPMEHGDDGSAVGTRDETKR